MQSLNIGYKLVRRANGRIELSLPLFLRGIYLAAGILLILVLSRSMGRGHPFVYMFGIAMLFVVMTEDRWIFDARAGTLTRRTGVMFLARKWTAPLESLASVETSADSAPADPNDPYARFNGAIGKNSCALRFALADGRRLTVSVVSRKRYDRLKAQAQAIAEFTGKPFVEA